MKRFDPCMCGAIDCPSCGPAQGYDVVRVYDPMLRRYVYRNPEDVEGCDEGDVDCDDESGVDCDDDERDN